MGVPYSMVLLMITKVALLTGCSVVFDVLGKIIYKSIVMLPETLETFHIHCGDLGT